MDCFASLPNCTKLSARFFTPPIAPFKGLRALNKPPIAAVTVVTPGIVFTKDRISRPKNKAAASALSVKTTAINLKPGNNAPVTSLARSPKTFCSFIKGFEKTQGEKRTTPSQDLVYGLQRLYLKVGIVMISSEISSCDKNIYEIDSMFVFIAAAYVNN